jgi:hypothetical protein
MSERKSRREIDKAIRHLMDYTGPNDEWASRLDSLMDQFLTAVADSLDLHLDEVSGYFMEGPFGHMVIGFLFEEYASVQWDKDEESLIDAYLKHRGWREGAAGRRYLQALGASELQFWEITAVKPGAYVELRAYGTSGQSRRVKERAASQYLNQWDGLVARVLPTGSGYAFSGAMLPFRPEVARRLHAVLEGLPDTARQMLQELVDQGELDTLPADMDTLGDDMAAAELPQIAFRLWAVDTYVTDNRPSPELRNMNDEPIEPTQLRFALRAEHAIVVKALDSSPVLERDADGSGWAWFPKPYADIALEERVSIQGHIALTDTALTLDTNSVARAERGRDMLSSLLGDSVGTPLTVHENLQRMVEDVEPIALTSDVPAEVQEAMAAQLTTHYRRTLDEAIPMLNGKTPRQCAADPALRNDVIGWLKSMENTDQRSPGPSYDFTWMWDELKLERG